MGIRIYVDDIIYQIQYLYNLRIEEEDSIHQESSHLVLQAPFLYGHIINTTSKLQTT